MAVEGRGNKTETIVILKTEQLGVYVQSGPQFSVECLARPGLTKLWLSTVTMVTKHNEPFCILPVSQHWAAVKAIGVTKQQR